MSDPLARWQRMIYAIALEFHRRFFRGKEDLEDIVQEAQVAAWRATERSNKDAPEIARRHYIRQSVKHALFNLYRAKAQKKRTLPSGWSPVEADDGGIGDVELREFVVAYGRRLTPRQYLILRELVWPTGRTVGISARQARKGLKCGDAVAIGKALGIDPCEVRRVRRALQKKLKLEIERPTIRRPRF